MTSLLPRTAITNGPPEPELPLSEVVVVGPGAIGLVVASALRAAGRPPLIAARSMFDRIEHVVGGESHVWTEPEVVTEPASVDRDRRFDLVFLATKAYQTEGAVPWLDVLCGPETIVAVLQNGIDHRQRLAPFVPADRVAPVVVNLPAERKGPGVVESPSTANLTVPNDPTGLAVSAALAGGPLAVNVVDDFITPLWTKLLINSSLGILGVLTGAPNGSIAEPDAAWLFRALVDEAAAVGRAEGANLPTDIADRLAHRILSGAPDHRSSIALDRAAGRQTEWRARNQIVLDRAAAQGIDVPLNRAGTTLMRLGEPNPS